MHVKDLIKKLESNSEFKEWKKENKKSYLVHVFKMIDEENKDIWQIGYYNKDDTITSFIIDKEDIKIVPEEKIFKEDKEKSEALKKLSLLKIKIDLDKALEIAKALQEKKFKGNEPFKIIIILQNLKIGQVYNITYITKTLNTLNIKINTEDSKIIKSELTPMMQFQAK